MQSLAEIGPVVLEKKIFFNFVNVFLLFCNYLPLEYGRALHLNKLESPPPKDTLCQVWLKLAQWFWRRKFFNFFSVFSLFRNYLSLGKARTLHLNKLEPSSPKNILCQVLPSGSVEEDFKILSMYFCYFVIISPWEKVGPFISIPFTQGGIVPSLVKISPVVLEKKIFKISSMYFRYIVVISPWKRTEPFI